MPLPPASLKSRMVYPLMPAYSGYPEKEAIKQLSVWCLCYY